MLTEEGPKVLEYNCRFGDPETQVLMPLLDDSCDLIDLVYACIEGRLDVMDIPIREGKHAASVVLASSGYPGSYEKYKPITFLPEITNQGRHSYGTIEDNEGKTVGQLEFHKVERDMEII